MTAKLAYKCIETLRTLKHPLLNNGAKRARSKYVLQSVIPNGKSKIPLKLCFKL